MNRRYAIWPLLSVILLASLLALPTPARARSVVVHSEPADGALLRAAPQTLQLWFDSAAIIEPGAVSLTGADGAEVAVASFHNDIYKPGDADLQAFFDPTYLFLCSLGLNSYPTTLTVHLPALGPGTYRLAWRALAIKDRQITSGTLVFAVDPGAQSAVDGADALTHSVTSLADDLMVTMAIRPNRPGANFISIQAAPVRRPMRAPINAVTLRLTAPGEPPRDIAVAQAPDGRFQVSGDLIDRPGLWTAEVRIDRGGAFVSAAPLSWDVPGRPAGSPLLWAALALVGLALAGGLFALVRRRQRLSVVPL